MQTLTINGDYIKLEAALKAAGWCGTGGQAKIRIQLGDVAVNGAQCLMRGKKCRPGDVIRMDGRELCLAGAPGTSAEP